MTIWWALAPSRGVSQRKYEEDELNRQQNQEVSQWRWQLEASKTSVNSEGQVEGWPDRGHSKSKTGQETDLAETLPLRGKQTWLRSLSALLKTNQAIWNTHYASLVGNTRPFSPSRRVRIQWFPNPTGKAVQKQASQIAANGHGLHGGEIWQQPPIWNVFTLDPATLVMGNHPIATPAQGQARHE